MSMPKRHTEPAFRIGSLFSGIGGLGLGLEWALSEAGLAPVVCWHVEQDPFCRSILAQHWPDAARHDDVRAVGAHNLAAVDLIEGGFPCQDVSVAGKGAGLAGARSGLWYEFARVVGELRPRFVVVENVSALLARGIGDVLGGLAALGYDAWWTTLRAADVGAPHRRERLFIVGWLADADALGWSRRAGVQRPGRRHEPPHGCCVAHPGLQHGDGRQDRDTGRWSHGDDARRAQGAGDVERSGGEPVADADQCGPCPTVARGERAGWPDALRSGDGVAHPDGDAVWVEPRRRAGAHRAGAPVAGASGVGQADISGARLEGQRQLHGQDPSGPGRQGCAAAARGGRVTEPRVGGVPDGPSSGLDGTRWPAGRGAEQHPWEPPRVTPKAPHRAARLKALGNAVVPQCGYVIGRVVAALATGEVTP